MNQNERHVAACLKACEGISTKKLEAMQVPFVEHLKSLGSIAQEKTEKIDRMKSELAELRRWREWSILDEAKHSKIHDLVVRARAKLDSVPDTESDAVNSAYNMLLEAEELRFSCDPKMPRRPCSAAGDAPKPVSGDVIRYAKFTMEVRGLGLQSTSTLEDLRMRLQRAHSMLQKHGSGDLLGSSVLVEVANYSCRTDGCSDPQEPGIEGGG